MTVKKLGVGLLDYQGPCGQLTSDSDSRQVCKEFIIRLRSGVFVKGFGGTSLRGLRNSWGKDAYTMG